MDEFSRNDSSLQVSQLVKKEGEGFLIARVFFDFDGVQDANANEINYKKVYIQPGNVALPYPDSPHVYFHNWDAFNPNPSNLFSKQQFDSAFTFFGSVSQFVHETKKVVTSAKPLTPQKRRLTTALSPSTKRTALKTQLISVVDEVVQDQEGLPATVTFLVGQGNWPFVNLKSAN